MAMYTQFFKRLIIPLDIIKRLPKRLLRLGRHFLFFRQYDTNIPVNSFADFVIDLPLYLLDVVGFPEIYQWTLALTRPHLRRLSDTELKIFVDVFGNDLLGRNIWINDRATWFMEKYAHAYVGSNVIHFSKKVAPHILVHEMVHICQYHNFGSPYVGRALRAQFSKEGYSYGKAIGLYNAMVKAKPYLSFNFEQQAQIIEDYYLYIQFGKFKLDPLAMQSYHYYHSQMKESFKNSNFMVF